ncbi:hypothetical protein [Nostoc sp.]
MVKNLPTRELLSSEAVTRGKIVWKLLLYLRYSIFDIELEFLHEG